MISSKILCMVSLLTQTKLILEAQNRCTKDYTTSKCTSTTFGLSKHHIFCFIDFGSKVMATTSIWMICNHHSPMCFFNLISWSGCPAMATIQNQISSKNMKKFMENILPMTIFIVIAVFGPQSHRKLYSATLL